MSTTSKTISTLNDLIETLKDGQNGFQTAAEKTDSTSLRTIFNRLSLQRSKFAGELQALAHSLGESSPEDSGSVAATLHRGWMDVVSALTSRDDHSILAECERGEDSAVAQYKSALEDDDLPQNVRSVVAQQYSAVQAAHDEVRDLRDSTSSTR